MKTTNDIATVDMHADGYPAFDFSADDAWPMPPVKPWQPKPRELTLGERMRAAVARWERNA